MNWGMLSGDPPIAESIYSNEPVKCCSEHFIQPGD
jgi:hypothetical protein